ncbi:MAG: hypothetical protein ACK4OF_03125 [Aquificaceae bacterium]
MIILREAQKTKELEEELIKRGWRESKFDGRRCLIKEEESWLWVYFALEEEIRFVSFSVEESSRLHSKGVERLKEELKDLGLSFSWRLEVG